VNLNQLAYWQQQKRCTSSHGSSECQLTPRLQQLLGQEPVLLILLSVLVLAALPLAALGATTTRLGCRLNRRCLLPRLLLLLLLGSWLLCATTATCRLLLLLLLLLLLMRRLRLWRLALLLLLLELPLFGRQVAPGAAARCLNRPLTRPLLLLVCCCLCGSRRPC
jgi:hypothetical protein